MFFNETMVKYASTVRRCLLEFVQHIDSALYPNIGDSPNTSILSDVPDWKGPMVPADDVGRRERDVTYHKQWQPKQNECVLGQGVAQTV